MLLTNALKDRARILLPSPHRVGPAVSKTPECYEIHLGSFDPVNGAAIPGECGSTGLIEEWGSVTARLGGGGLTAGQVDDTSRAGVLQVGTERLERDALVPFVVHLAGLAVRCNHENVITRV